MRHFLGTEPCTKIYTGTCTGYLQTFIYLQFENSYSLQVDELFARKPYIVSCCNTDETLFNLFQPILLTQQLHGTDCCLRGRVHPVDFYLMHKGVFTRLQQAGTSGSDRRRKHVPR